MKVITIKAWNRPSYLFQVLHHLKKCKNISDYKIIISIDLTDNQSKMLSSIRQSKIRKKCDVSINIHEIKYGCAGNTRWCLEQGFNYDVDYVLHLEEDTIPAKDYLVVMEWIGKVLLENTDIFAGCPFIRKCHLVTIPTRKDIKKSQLRYWFEPCGGFIITRRRWEEILEKGGMFGVRYITEKGRKPDCYGKEWLYEIIKDDSGSWGWPFCKYFADGRASLFPYISRIKNIGAVGLHMNQNIFTNYIYHDYWSGNTNYWVEDYCMSENIEIDQKKYYEFGII